MFRAVLCSFLGGQIV